MTNEHMQHMALQAGEYVADAQLAEMLGEGGGVQAWSAIRDDGDKAIVYTLDPAIAVEVRDTFLGAAADAARPDVEVMKGVLRVVAVDPVAGAYVGDLTAAGTLGDLPTLGWKQDRQLALFRKLVGVVAALHDQGVVHGWLRPENVLLDTELNPVIANARGMDIGTLCRTDANMVWIHRVYAAPEVRHGATSDPPADVYALGRILHFMLIGKEPEEKDEALPRLDMLGREAPNPIVRIVRKCTMMDSAARYQNARELGEDMVRMARHVPAGMPHPDVDGHEESSLDDRPSARPSARPSGRPAGGPSTRPSARPPSLRSAVEVSRSTGADRQFWSVGIAVGFGLLGLLQLTIPAALTYWTGLQHLALDIVTWAAAVPFGLASPGFSKRKWLGRIFTGVAAGAAIVMLDPVMLAANARVAGLRSNDLETRVARFKTMRAGGEREFRGLDLAGGDISGMDLNKTALEGTNLEGANCTNTDFSGAVLENVKVAGADLSGANLTGVVGPIMIGLERAKCDNRTQMPEGYACKDGSAVTTFSR